MKNVFVLCCLFIDSFLLFFFFLLLLPNENDMIKVSLSKRFQGLTRDLFFTPGGGLANSRREDKTQRAGGGETLGLERNWEGSLIPRPMEDDGDGIFDHLLQSECDDQPVFFSGVPRSVFTD